MFAVLPPTELSLSPPFIQFPILLPSFLLPFLFNGICTSTALVKRACLYFKFLGFVLPAAQTSHRQRIGHSWKFQAQLSQPGASLFVQRCTSIGLPCGMWDPMPRGSLSLSYAYNRRLEEGEEIATRHTHALKRPINEVEGRKGTTTTLHIMWSLSSVSTLDFPSVVVTSISFATARGSSNLHFRGFGAEYFIPLRSPDRRTERRLRSSWVPLRPSFFI